MHRDWTTWIRALQGAVFTLDKRRWLLVLDGFLINLCLGVAYSWSVFVLPLQEYFTSILDHTVAISSIFLPFSIFLASLALAVFFTGKYIDIYGPRPIAIFGGVLTGVGWIFSSLSPSPEMLTLFYGIMGGFGTGTCYSVPLAISARWFPDRRGLAIGLTVLGFGLSTLLVANILVYFIETYGVMSTFRILGILIMGLVTLLALPLSFPPEGWLPQHMIQQQTTLVKNQSNFLGMSVAQMLRTSTFYGLWGCYFIGCLVGLMAIGISKPCGMDLGLTSVLATQILGVFALSNSIGRPFFGTLTDRMTPQKTAIIAFAIVAGAALALCLSQTLWIYIITFTIFWGCFGGWLIIAPTACGNYFGMKYYSQCYGCIYLAYGVGGIAGPIMAGVIKASTGTYFGVFPYIVLLSLIGIIIAIIFLKPPHSASVEGEGGQI